MQLNDAREKTSGDILVNNAGFDVYETDLTKELQMIQVNLVTLTQLTKLLVGGMVKRRYGKIINVGSIGSFVSTALNAGYGATKAPISHNRINCSTYTFNKWWHWYRTAKGWIPK